MSTHNMCFFEEIWNIISKLSSNTHYVCFSYTYLENFENEKNTKPVLSIEFS